MDVCHAVCSTHSRSWTQLVDAAADSGGVVATSDLKLATALGGTSEAGSVAEHPLINAAYGHCCWWANLGPLVEAYAQSMGTTLDIGYRQIIWTRRARAEFNLWLYPASLLGIV